MAENTTYTWSAYTGMTTTIKHRSPTFPSQTFTLKFQQFIFRNLTSISHDTQEYHYMIVASIVKERNQAVPQGNSGQSAGC